MNPVARLDLNLGIVQIYPRRRRILWAVEVNREDRPGLAPIARHSQAIDNWLCRVCHRSPPQHGATGFPARRGSKSAEIRGGGKFAYPLFAYGAAVLFYSQSRGSIDRRDKESKAGRAFRIGNTSRSERIGTENVPIPPS